MIRQILTLLLATASLAPALTINFDQPAYSLVNPPNASDVISLNIDNTDPLGPHFAQWILVYFINVLVAGPSAPADLYFAEAITGLPPGALLIQPGGTLLLGVGLFLAEPGAVAGLHNLSFEVFYDAFDTDPIDPTTLELDPNVLAALSNVYPLIYADLNVTIDPVQGVPEPNTGLMLATAALAGLAIRRRRRRG